MKIKKLLVLGAAALLSGAVHAGVSVFGQLGIAPNFSGGTGPFNQSVIHPSGAIDLTGSATGGFGSFGSGTVHVEEAIIKMSGSFSGTGNSVVRGIYRDDVPIIVPGVANGTLTAVTFKLVLGGTLDASSVGLTRAQYLLQGDLGGGFFDINRSGAVTNAGFSGDPFGLYTATVNVGAGILAPLDVELTGTAQAQFNFDGGVPSADFFLDHSLYWGGITSVKVGGVEMPFTAIGVSGTDWSKSFVPAPVPEPETYAMMLAGLGLLGFVARRRKLRAA